MIVEKETINETNIQYFHCWLLQNVHRLKITKIINQFRIRFEANEHVILSNFGHRINLFIISREKSKQHHS